MIVYSFAWRRKEHSCCNIRLAKAAKRIALVSGSFRIVAQRTTAAVLQELGVKDVFVVKKRPGYEGSKDVTDQAAEVFRAEGITEVIPIAQPLLQLTKCIQLVRKAGFRTLSFWKLCRMIGWIGFDRKSVQPWTRDPVRLVFHAFRQIFFGYQPPPELSE